MQRSDALPEELDIQVYGNKDNEYVLREHLNRSIAATTWCTPTVSTRLVVL